MKDVKEKLLKASEIYGDQTLIRAAINAIPFIGGPLDILLSTSGQNFVIKRIETFISELNNQISTLSKSQINRDFLSTEEGLDLIVKAFGSASRTRQKEKLRLYARIIKTSLTKSMEFQEDDPELFLRIIEELSVKEFRIAKLLFDHKVNLTGAELVNVDDAWWLAKNYPEFNIDELVSILVRLEKTGLIKEIIFTTHGAGGGAYQINYLFRKLIDFISDSD